MDVNAGSLISPFQDLDKDMLKIVSFSTYRKVQWSVDHKRTGLHVYVIAKGTGTYIDSKIRDRLWTLNIIGEIEVSYAS